MRMTCISPFHINTVLREMMLSNLLLALSPFSMLREASLRNIYC